MASTFTAMSSVGSIVASNGLVMDKKLSSSSNRLSSLASISSSSFLSRRNVVLRRSRLPKISAAKELHFNKDGLAIKKLQTGVNKLADLVRVTLGPKGMNDTATKANIEGKPNKVSNLHQVPRSSIRDLDIDLNVGCSDQYGGGLQIHPVVIETNALSDNGLNNNGCSDYECEDFSDPDLDDIPNDEGPDDGNDHAPSIENLSHGIIICNDLGAYMSNASPDSVHASKFPEYLDIIPTHLMLEDLESEKLFVSQRFTSKGECANAIKCYSLKVSAD
ncbi:hypothetical protein PVK06_034821 [Gossypium arboreum]|uniref:Uncharacterized protein n=1 Tax=Gossypium arboreum TaxID=29729 RepID=A0ABR0NHD3_GOSAR|nr:hypothetical protein PVK06_034821 [Gossypium arboreum]